MVFTAWWAITYSLELSSDSLRNIIFWLNLEYVGITMLPVTWLFFVTSFINQDEWIKGTHRLLFFIVPLATLLIVWTNPLHHLYYNNLSLDTSGAFPLLVIERGVWYKMFTVYFYLNLAVGIYFLIASFKKQGWIYRKQKIIIVVAALIPWIANLMYIFGYRPLNHLDVTPFAFITSALLVGFGFVRFNLFDIVPVARGKIVEAFRDGVIVIDVYNRIIDVNGQMLQILSKFEGVKPIGTNIKQVLKDELLLHKAIDARTDSKIELSIGADDDQQSFEVDINFLLEKNSVISGAIILFRDITHRKNWEKTLSEQANQLTELNQVKDRLFSIIAHDLRGPIMNLKLLVNMIDTGMISDLEFKAFVPELSKKLGYTSGLLENLLYWSKSQLDGQKVEPTNFSIKKIVDNEIQYATHKATEKGIEIFSSITDIFLVYADTHMIELIVRNLISNAIKFSGNGDLISIIAEQVEGNSLKVCVKDTGTGMTNNQIENLFSIKSVSTLGTNNEKGTGLGLQLCKDFIERNEGKLWVESELGKGTKICFTVPVAKVNVGANKMTIY